MSAEVRDPETGVTPLETVVGAAIHDSLCSRCADVGSGLEIRSLDMGRAAPAVLAALEAAGYAVVRLPEVQETGTTSAGQRWVHCGPAHGAVHPDGAATAGLPGVSYDLPGAMTAALSLLAAARWLTSREDSR